MERRLALTDFQKIIVYLAVVVAVFCGAMALGRWSLWLFLAGVGILSVVVMAAYTIQARRRTGGNEIATAQVLSASAVPAHASIAAACSMRLAVYLSGRGKVETRLRDAAVPLSRWPAPGQTFPVEIAGGNPHRRLRIRWDLVDAGLVRDPSRPTAKGKGGGHQVWENDEQPVIFSPTPPRPRRPSATQTPHQPTQPVSHTTTYTTTHTVQPPSAPPAPPFAPVVTPPPTPHLYEDYVDREDLDNLDDDTVRTGPRPTAYLGDLSDVSTRRLPPPLADDQTNGHDPDGYDPADFEAPRLEAVPLPDFDPAEVDRRDFEGTRLDEPTEKDPVGPTIPLPRDPADPARGGTGVDASLPVADMARSLHFYRDLLGFTVTDVATSHAVVEGRGARILLESVGDPTGLPLGVVHLEVTDIDATCAELRARGIRLLQSPVATGGGEGAQLWRARLRDPDGHDVELVEWREH